MQIPKVSLYTQNYYYKTQNTTRQFEQKNVERQSDMSCLEALSFYNMSFLGKPKNALYSIDRNKNYKKYESAKQAAKAVGSITSSVTAAAEGKIKSTAGYAFAYASEIEIEDENGNITVDEDIVAQLAETKFTRKQPQKEDPIYSIDEKGNCKKYKNSTEAAIKLGCGSSSITNVLSGGAKTSRGLAFVRAEAIETKDEDGNVTLDENKIAKIVKASFTRKEFDRVRKAVYAIDRDGNYKKFGSIKEAAEKLNMPLSAVASSLHHRRTSQEYKFVPAEEVEIENENGEIVVDEEKINNVIKHTSFMEIKGNVGRKPRKSSPEGGHNNKYERVKIYAMCPNGEYKTFKGITSVSEELGIDKDDILASMKQGKWINGYCFSSDFDK